MRNVVIIIMMMFIHYVFVDFKEAQCWRVCGGNVRRWSVTIGGDPC